VKQPLPDIPPSPLARRLAALALVGAGVAAGIGQVVLIRELMNIAAGNELTIGLMLAGWFLWGAVGASLASRWMARIARTHDVMDRVAGMATMPFWVLLLQIDFIRLVPLILSQLAAGWNVQAGEVMGLPQLLAVTVVAVLPAGMLAGAQFTAGLALYSRLATGSAAPGRAYAADAVGHLTGGVLAAVLLTRGWQAHPMAVVAGGVSFALVLPLTFLVAERRLRQWTVPFVLVVSLLVLLGRHAVMHPISRLEVQARESHPLAEIETVHGSLGVVKWGERGVYFYVNGVPEFPSPPTPAMQHLVHFPMLQTARASGTDAPTRVLLIGGGAAGALREVLQYGPQVRVDYVELDPGLIRLAREYLVRPDREALEDRRVRVVVMDGRRWVKATANGVLTPTPLPRPAASGEGNGTATAGGVRAADVPSAYALQNGHGNGATPAAYDVVLLGVPEPMTAQINRFYTKEFFEEVAAIMTADGVIGLQMPSSDMYLGDELLRLNAVLLRTVQHVFPQVALLPGYEMVVAASRSARLTEDAEVLRERMDRLGIVAPDFRAHVWDRLFPLEVRQVKETLDGAPPLPLNTDARPIGYFYGQAYWVAQHSRTSWAVFEWLSRLTLRRVLAPLAGVFAVLAIAGLLSRRVARGFVPLAIFGTGAIAMALEVTLLLAFQVYYGYVYAQIGVLTGAFMLGLAGGSLIAGGRLQAVHRGAMQARAALAGTQAAVTVVALALPWLLQALGAWTAAGAALAPHVLFPLLAAVVGLTVGAEFPLAAAAAGHESSARAGAAMYAADLLGACLGALVGGAMLLPVLGLPGTCTAAAAVSAGLCALLLLGLRRSRGRR
jgi:spermidine synthase